MPNVTTHKGFHVPNDKYFEYSEKAVERALESGQINFDDISLIKEFIGEISMNIAPERVYKLHYILINWRNFIKPYRENTAADLFSGMEKIKRFQKKDGKYYSKNTLGDYVKFLKRFYLWMSDNEYTNIPEKKIKKFKIPKPPQMSVTAEELLSEEDILKMIDACWNSRDRALISMLYEGAFRIGELGNLQWKQIKFNSWNTVVNVDSKTDRPRYIPLLIAKPYIAQWKNDYPFEPEGDNHVFLSFNDNEPIQYRGMQKKILKIAEKAGITKKIHPHLFRHSRITHLIQKGYSESCIKKMGWGNLTTNMFSTYAHLTDSDIDNEIAKQEGIITEDKPEHSPLEARQCPRCYTINGPTMNFCGSCGLELTPEALAEKKELMDNLHNLNKEQLLDLVQKALTG